MKLLPVFVCAAALLAAAERKLGKPLTLKKPSPVADILARPADYVGKTVQVRGKVTEVCQMMGCWMNLAGDNGKSIRIKVNDGEIEFPKDAPGRMAVAEGKLTKIEMTRAEAVAEAKHEAEEAGRKFNPASIKGGLTVYQIQGTGAVIE